MAKKSLGKRLLPVWQVALIDILIAGIALVIFAYFHHVRPSKLESEDIEIARPTASVSASVLQTPTPLPEETVELTPTPLPAAQTEPDEPGKFYNKFADKFTSGEVVSYIESGVAFYQSKSLNITVTREKVASTKGGEEDCTVYITDFYVGDIECLSTVFANDSYSVGNYEWLTSMSERVGAIVAVNGDFYGARKNGVVIRNGKMYRSKHSTFDACVIYWDGTMETYASSDWDAQTLIDNNAYQAWSFGPRLLDENGTPLKKFNATDAVIKKNPRTAIGYFEPGHYCFVTVDGRSSASNGFTMSRLAEFMSEIGCTAAYNLDGGQSSSLVWGSEVISKPYKDGRKISDAIVLIDIE